MWEEEGVVKEDSIPALKSKYGQISSYLQRPCCCCFCCGKRWTIVVIIMFGFFISSGIRCNVGVTVIKMVSNETDEHGDLIEIGEFHWQPDTIGFVDASFFWGFIITQLLGGIVSTYFSAHLVFGSAIFFSSILNCLIPASTQYNPRAVMVVRFIQGLADGLTIPATFGILRWWAPPLERTSLANLALSGCYVGSAIETSLSGYLRELLGWDAPYFFYGCSGILWFMLWMLLCFEKPSKHPAISLKEQQYIQKSLQYLMHDEPTISTTPWFKILFSFPVWAIFICNFVHSWSFYLVFNTLPEYIVEVVGRNIELELISTTIAYLIVAMSIVVGGMLSDFLRKKKAMSDTNVRKFFNTIGFAGQATSLLIVGSAEKEVTIGLALLGTAFSFGVSLSGFYINFLDIAPRHASILVGISNEVGTLGGILSLMLTEYLTMNNVHIGDTQWQYVFIIASTLNMFGLIFYLLFSSSDLQHWAITPEAFNTMARKKKSPRVKNIRKVKNENC